MARRSQTETFDDHLGPGPEDDDPPEEECQPSSGAGIGPDDDESSCDAQEGISAFLAKRTPRFNGN